MTLFEILSILTLVLSVGQLLRYLQTRNNIVAPSGYFIFKYFLLSMAMVVLVTISAKYLVADPEMRHKVLFGIWLVIFSLLFWRTKVLKDAQKAENA